MPGKGAKPKRAIRKRATGAEGKIAFYDAKTRRVKSFRKDRFREELEKVATMLKDALAGFEKIGNYSLDEIEISLGVTAGYVVVTVEGGISLRYARAKAAA